MYISGSEAFVFSTGFVETSKGGGKQVEETTWKSPAVEAARQQLLAYFDGVLKAFSLPVQQPGTDFQQKVWQQLMQIAYGETVSYLDVAKRLGDPKVIRAAASANGKNNLAIIIPCHRVVGKNGALTGYAGDLWRKRWLLEHEQKHGHLPVQLSVFG